MKRFQKAHGDASSYSSEASVHLMNDTFRRGVIYGNKICSITLAMRCNLVKTAPVSHVVGCIVTILLHVI